jgi:hypothetical protein
MVAVLYCTVRCCILTTVDAVSWELSRVAVPSGSASATSAICDKASWSLASRCTEAYPI